jgi:hypothetical protein
MALDNSNTDPSTKGEVKNERDDSSNKNNDKKGGGRSCQFNKYNKKSSDKSNGQFQKKPNTKTVGKIEDMNGHVFEYSHNTTQFTNTCEKLERYCTKPYKYGNDLRYMVRHMKDKQLEKPIAPVTIKGTSEMDPTDKLIWTQEVNNFVKRKVAYETDKANLATIIWGQSSEALQAKLRTLPDFEEKFENDDSLWLLSQIRAIVYKFESQGSMYKSLYQAHRSFLLYRQASMRA